jgi:signal transduction histidine kinase/ligand-binding sensor domain-containing protein
MLLGFYTRIGIILAVFFPCASFGADTITSSHYLARAWQAEEGLPQNKVTAVVQTHDGYLWVGTYSGLARFDGVRFTVFDDNNTPELHGSRVTSLFESPDGTLWIGRENGEVTSYKNGKFQAVPIRAAWSGGKIYAIASDEIGDVWLINEEGLLARLRDGLVLTPATGSAAKIVDITRSPNGTIWVARDGRLSELARGQLHTLQLDATRTNIYVQGIAASRDGGLWIASDGRIRKWKDGNWIQDLGVAPWGMAALTSLVETRNGTLLAGTSNNGLFLLFPDMDEKSLHFNRASGFQSDWVISLMDDREGNFWVGTGGEGLISLHPNNIQTISPPDQWEGRAVLSVCQSRDGAMWIGTEGAGLYRYQSGTWTNFAHNAGLVNPYVWSLGQDAAGDFFAGTWGGGLFLQNSNRFEIAPGMENITPPMPAILCARDGSLWIGTAAGLLHYQSGKTNWFTEANGQPLRDVRTVAEDRQGAVWFGMAGNGLAVLQNQIVRQFRQTDGLSSDFIECLHFDENGALWIGTFGGGLIRFNDGHFAVINRRQGLPNSVIGDIEDDGCGFFWMSSHGGIIRASKEELNRCADGEIKEVRFQTYGINDGLPTIECSEGLQPAGCKTADGLLCFPTSKGLVVINPTEVRINHLPPPVVLEELLVDGQPATNRAAPLKIPPGKDRLEFQYTGLSFVAPEKVRFKYRIEGLEKDWLDAGTRRSVSYSFIPPGNYTFHVIACNNDEIWNDTGASLAFIVLPHFWQTWWFRALTIAVIAVAAGGAVWFEMSRRVRRRLERLERQHAVERERARIAQDIHDDLGASLTCITMLSQSAREEPQNPGEIASNLNRIYGTARELTRSMDEIVWAVNPRHDTLDSLASYLSRFAQEFLQTANIRCRLDVPVQFPPLPLTAEVRHNLFLALKEALHNVVKHAAALEVRVSLLLQAAVLTLTIEDDGRGFDVNAHLDPNRVAEGDGLANMRRRLAEVGGVCEIISSPGQGTKVKFTATLNRRHRRNRVVKTHDRHF